VLVVLAVLVALYRQGDAGRTGGMECHMASKTRKFNIGTGLEGPIQGGDGRTGGMECHMASKTRKFNIGTALDGPTQGDCFSTQGASLGMALVSAGLGHFLGDRTGAAVAAGIGVLVAAVEADQEQSDPPRRW